jgi:hypothetical protein
VPTDCACLAGPRDALIDRALAADTTAPATRCDLFFTGATLDAFGWKLESAEMSLSGNSTANLYVSEEHAEIEKDNSSSVNLQGK